MTAAVTRAALVTDALHPYHKGGKETRYRELIARLPRHGVDVDVYTMRWWGSGPAPDGPVTYHAVSPCVPLYRRGRRSVVQALVFALGCLRLLGARCDVIEADSMPYLLLFPLRLVAWVRRVPLVVTWNEFWGTRYWRDYLGPLGPLAALVERTAAALPDHIVAISAGTAERLVAAGIDPARVTVVPVGIDDHLVDAVSATAAAPDLVVVGRLVDHKRADVALAALAHLRAQGRDVTLGVVGTGPEHGRLTALADELGVGAHTVFYGALETEAEVLGLLAGATVVLFPSEREGFGLVAAEALALGTPVITSDAAGNEARHLVSRATGAVVPAGDDAAFAAAAAAWLDEPACPVEVADAFFAHHPELTWDAIAARYHELLDTLARPRPRRSAPAASEVAR